MLQITKFDIKSHRIDLIHVYYGFHLMKILSILFRLLLLSEFEYHLLVEILSDI